MSRLLARLILAFALVAAVIPVYVSVFAILEPIIRDETSLWVATLVTGILFGVAWIAIWAGQVSWTPSRRRLTALAVLWSVGAAAVMGMTIAVSVKYDGEALGIVLGSMFWLVAWLASTALVWRETSAERAARLKAASRGVVTCLRCGYNMTGLREARCPECGTQYTLDELLASLTEQNKEIDE